MTFVLNIIQYWYDLQFIVIFYEMMTGRECSNTLPERGKKKELHNLKIKWFCVEFMISFECLMFCWICDVVLYVWFFVNFCWLCVICWLCDDADLWCCRFVMCWICDVVWICDGVFFGFVIFVICWICDVSKRIWNIAWPGLICIPLWCSSCCRWRPTKQLLYKSLRIMA